MGLHISGVLRFCASCRKGYIRGFGENGAGSAAICAGQAESLPVLTGIVHSAGQDGALFRGAENSAGHLVRQGESVAGWRVVAVTRESVTLERGGEQIVQQPDFQHHLDTEMVDHSPAAEAAE